MTSEASYDVFLSLAGPDRLQARFIADALCKARLRVFVDERSIEHFAGITPQIEQALRSSKTLLAYYSKAFASRSACQFELTAAILAGFREGRPTHRIMVINPEVAEEHIQPVELADDRFMVLPASDDAAALADLVEKVRRRANSVSGSIGGLPFTRDQRWFGIRPSDIDDCVGRYREQWQIHSQLRRADFPLTQGSRTTRVAAVVGLSGIGKSAVVAAYARQFDAAHPAGVYWVSLAGAGTTPEEMTDRFAAELRKILSPLGQPLTGASPEQIRAAFIEQVVKQSEPSLLVLDDVPVPLDKATVESLTVDSGLLRTIIISQKLGIDQPTSPVEIGPMALEDATTLLNLFRAADGTDEIEAQERVAKGLGMHAYALKFAGQALRDRNGFVSYDDYARRIDADPASLASVTALIQDAMSRLEDVQQLILRLSVLCSAAALPARLIQRVVGTLHHAADTPEFIGDAMAALRNRLLASSIGDDWQIHALVRAAAAQLGQTPASVSSLATVTAESILALTADEATTVDQDVSAYLQHAFTLATRSNLGWDLGERLVRRAVAYFDGRGQHHLAIPGHRLLVARFPDQAAELLAAARAAHQAGESEQAIGYAQTVLAQPDGSHDHQAHQIVAEALDACARFQEADRHWAETVTNGSTAAGDTAENLSTRVAWIRGMRLRGHNTAARQAVNALLENVAGNASESAFDEVQAAYLELAAIMLTTDDPRGAMEIALRVLERYQARGLPHHRHAWTTQQILADAQLTPPFWQLHPDPAQWLSAEATLRRVRDDHQRTHGRRHWFTLAASVAHAHALVSLGEPKEAREAIQVFLQDLRQRLGSAHPMYLQACFLLGLSHAQVDDYRQAEVYLRQACDGATAILSPSHPQRLRTQFEYGVALKMNGKPLQAARMFTAVRKAAPQAVGVATDLYWQSVFATVLNLLPARVWWAARAKPKRR